MECASCSFLDAFSDNNLNDVFFFCTICHWTKTHVQCIETDPSFHCRGEYLCPVRSAILRGMHEEPPQVWKNVMLTSKLCSGFLVQEAGQEWFELPLRNMQPILEYSESFSIQMGSYESPVTKHFGSGVSVSDMYHVTQLKSLVEPMEGCPESQGFLKDGFLRYGACTHAGLSGVNYYSLNPETCKAGDGWCILKISVSHGRRLKGGARHRQCIPGPFTAPCMYATVNSLMVLRVDIPSLLFLAV